MKLALSNRFGVSPNSLVTNARGGWSGPDPSRVRALGICPPATETNYQPGHS